MTNRKTSIQIERYDITYSNGVQQIHAVDAEGNTYPIPLAFIHMCDAEKYPIIREFKTAYPELFNGVDANGKYYGPVRKPRN